MVAWDSIVVGGSVAGAAAAYFLGREGRRVLLLEKNIFPRQKACGEGIMPHGLPVLEEMGVLEEVRRCGRPFSGLVYRNRRGEEAVGDFREGPGLAVRRMLLDQILLRRAAQVATVREGCAVEAVFDGGVKAAGETIEAPQVIVADGPASRSRAQLGIETIPPPRPRFGVTGHWLVSGPLPERVEVTLVDDGERYVAAVEEGMILVALLLERRAMEGMSEEVYRRRAGVVGEFVGPMQSAGPLGLRARRCVEGGVVLIGDAAGAPDPMSGEGIALALRCARRIDPAEHERLRAGVFAFSDRLLQLTRMRGIADRTIAALAARPERFQAILDAAGRGEAPRI